MRYNETGYILGRFPGVEEHRMIDKDFIDHLEEQIHQTVQDALYLKETVVRTVRENVDAHKGPAPTHRPVPPRGLLPRSLIYIRGGPFPAQVSSCVSVGTREPRLRVPSWRSSGWLGQSQPVWRL